MSRLPFLILYLFGASVVFSQIQSEEITLHNKEIELLGTLSYSKENTPLIIGFTKQDFAGTEQMSSVVKGLEH